MEEYKKIESIARNVSKRYNKGTICSPITDSALLDFIEKNNLLPEGFTLSGTGRNYGYNIVRNRLLSMPIYTYRKVLDQFKEVTGTTVTKEDNINQVMYKLSVLKGVEDMLKQNLIIIFPSNFSPKRQEIDSLRLYNILIEDIDIMGTIEGRLVPKTGNFDSNADNKI